MLANLARFGARSSVYSTHVEIPHPVFSVLSVQIGLTKQNWWVLRIRSTFADDRYRAAIVRKAENCYRCRHHIAEILLLSTLCTSNNSMFDWAGWPTGLHTENHADSRQQHGYILQNEPRCVPGNGKLA